MTAVTLSLSVGVRPTPSALARLLSILHSRNAEVLAFNWLRQPERFHANALIMVRLDETRQGHLRMALERAVDVTDVEVAAAPREAGVRGADLRLDAGVVG